MFLALVAAHVILSLLLIIIVILQPGKGGDVGAAFGGGGGSSVFGPRGPSSMLQRFTTAIAILFMVTSISLAYMSNKTLLAGGSDVLDEIEKVRQEKEAASKARIEADIEKANAELGGEADVGSEPVEEPVAPSEPAAPADAPEGSEPSE